MLVIRRTQMQAFEAAQRRAFETTLRLHVQDFFPDIYHRMGEDAMGELVVSTIGKAGQFGITREQDVCRFLDMVMIFGPAFSSRYDWAVALLNDPMLNDSQAKTDALYQTGVAYLERHGDPPAWYDNSMQAGGVSTYAP